ncbi:MAG: GNAT family N-acetyltransferase [Pseudomonadota bacterium]
MDTGWSLRPVRDDDAPAITVMIAEVFAQFEGCVFDMLGEWAHIYTPASWAAEEMRAFWVVESNDDKRILATVACAPAATPEDPAMAELKHLYVADDARRLGLGKSLVEHVENHARDLGVNHIFLWSDTRFTAAHRLYKRLGYTQSANVRALWDISNSFDYRFDKGL